MKQAFLITLLALLCAVATADTYIIGTGTSASSLYPIYGSYDYSWSKQIYTAAEINAAGLTEAADITGVGLYVGNTPANYVMADQRIYMRHSTLTLYGTATDETGSGYPDNTGFTQVFQGTLTFDGGGWMYIMFDDAFSWNNTANLEILWENWNNNGLTGYPSFRYTAMGTGNYLNVYKYQNDTFPAVAGTRSTSRPNITIITPSDDPPNPALLVYPADNGWAFTDALLSWGDGGGLPDGYDVYLGPSATELTLVSNDQTGTSYDPDLAANTSYYWQVVPYNANGPAENCPVWSFQTPTATQLAESFDATAFPPPGWLRTTSSTTYWGRSATSPYYGTGCMYTYTSTSTPYTISTPMLAIGASSSLDFFAKASATTQVLQILQSTDRTNWTQFGTDITFAATGVWYPVSLDLSGLTPGDYYLAFHSPMQSAASYIYIDHVIGPEPAAVAPGPVTLTAPADMAIDVNERPTFTWTGPTLGGIPTGYRVYCDTNANPTTLLADVTALTYTATTALLYSTPYYWKVEAYNASGTSTGNTVWSFTTRADPTIYDLPWLEDFGTTGTTFPPTNWTRYAGLLADPISLTPNTSSTYWYYEDWLNTVTNPVNYSACFEIWSTGRNHWLVTPPIQIPATGYQLEFDLALTDWNNANPIEDPLNGLDDKFAVLIGDGATWSVSDVVLLYDNSGSPYVYNNIPHTGVHVTIPLDAYAGIKQIAFYGESTVSNADNDLFVDNVLVRQTPAGAPEHVTLTAPPDDATGLPLDDVVLAWTPSLTGGTAAYFEVYVGENPLDPGTDYYGEYMYTTTATSLDLTAQTDIEIGYSDTWYWAVLPYNSDDLAPDPNDPEFMIWNFTMMPDPTVTEFPYGESFDDPTFPPQGWTNVKTAGTGNPGIWDRQTSGTSPTCSPHSGAAMARYNSYSLASGTKGELTTPPLAIPVGGAYRVKFWMYRDSGYSTYSNEVVNVYVNSTPNSTGGTLLGTISRYYGFAPIEATANQWYPYSFAIPVETARTNRYITFEAVSQYGNNMFVDDVVVEDIPDLDMSATSLACPTYGNATQDFTADITVKNEGTLSADSYHVKLMSVDTRTELASVFVDTPLAAGASATHSVIWTPAAAGVFDVYGSVVFTGDENATNNSTGTKTVYIAPADWEFFLVGNPASTSTSATMPLYFYYKNNVSETIYFNDELRLASGTITAIAYKNSFTQDLQDKAVKIYMANTELENLSGGWIPGENFTLVFNGTVDFPQGVNQVIIPLQTSFAYTGGNLVIRANRPYEETTYNSTNYFYYTSTSSTHPNRSRYLSSSTTTYDPLAPSGTGTISSNAPNTWIVVDDAVPDPSANMEGYVYESGTTNPIAGSTVTLTDERYSTTTGDNGFYSFLFWEPHTVTATASKAGYYDHTVTGIALTLGNTVNQNFSLQPMPRVTVSGTVTANDYPAGLEGATIELSGPENHEVLSLTDGTFSIADVLGSSAGIAYTVTVSKDGYQSYSGSVTVYETAVNLGAINLIEYLWTPYNLVATHEGDNARLNWEAAAPPDYFIFDFESDDGGWVPSSNWSNPLGDWEWSNVYNVANYSNAGSTYTQTPPTAAYSGTGLWGTVVFGPYSNSGGWSYLTQTFDLTGFTNTQLRFWRWNDLFGSFDYWRVYVNGTQIFEETAIGQSWVEKVIDLSAYDGQTNVEIKFAEYASTVVNYAGLYIDDVYIGPAPTREISAQIGASDGSRALLNYDVYRFLSADEATPANWTLLNGAVAELSYLDTGFAAQPEGAYEWAVKANYSGDLESEAIFSNILGIVGIPALDEGTIGVVGNDVSITWPAEPGATYYVIYGSDDPYATWPWTLVGYSATPSYNFPMGTAPYKFFRVTAADGEMPASPPAKSK